MRGANLTSCGIMDSDARYSWHTVHVESLSADTLNCSVQFTCSGSACFPTTTASGKVVLAPRSNATVIRACMQPENAYEIKADCLPRPARAPLKVPANCRYDPVGPVALETYYPPASRRLREQGPVDIAFTLKDAEGFASNAEVVGSSLSARLDEAGLRALRALKLRTTCPGTRFEMRLKFEIDSDSRGAITLERSR